MRKLQGLALGIALISGQFAVAQEKTNAQGNPLSLRPVNDANVMYKVTLWRKIDLREKMNQPFFSKGNEITKHLIEGVKAGVLDAYANDSLATKLTLEQFSERLQIKEEGGGLSQEEKDAGFTNAPSGDDGWGGGADSASKNNGFGNNAVMPSGATEYFPNQLTTLELKEDWLFDKQRSRQYYDIQSLGIIIPASQTALGFDRAIAYFKYKDLDRFFRSNPKCIWYNAANVAQHKNLADAFELRFFRGRITKKSNAADRDLDDIFKSAREGLLKAEQVENELMEFEHNLWEY